MNPIPYQKVHDGKIKEVLLAHGGKTQADIKYNGYRSQLSIEQGRATIRSKSLEELSLENFPEIAPDVKRYKTGALVFDSELVGAAGGTEGLKAIQTRAKMKHPDAKTVADYPLQLRVFDLLYYNGDVMHKPLQERRHLLEGIVEGKNILLAENRIITREDHLQDWYDEVVQERKEEGIVCKNLTSPYLPGQRSKDWIRLVAYKTLDLVVAGFYKGEGKEAHAPFAAVLLCAYNEDTKTFETLVKCGVTGRCRDDLAARLYASRQATPPENILFNEKLFTKKAYDRKIPFAYIDPKKSLVVTVKSKGGISFSDNWHSCGGIDTVSGVMDFAYSLLIPIITTIRDPMDKKPYEATTTQQIAELYAAQMKDG